MLGLLYSVISYVAFLGSFIYFAFFTDGIGVSRTVNSGTIGSPVITWLVDIGLVPDNGGSFYAVRLLGYARAFEWLATGRRLGAEEALRMGFVSEVTEPLELLSRALAIAAELAEKPGLAVGLTKRLLNQAYRGQLAEQLEAEAALQALAVVAPGRAEARAKMVARISGNGGESK